MVGPLKWDLLVTQSPIVREYGLGQRYFLNVLRSVL